MTPDARELHRVISASVRELLETARLEAQAGAMDAAQLERLIFRAAAPILHSVYLQHLRFSAQCLEQDTSGRGTVEMQGTLYDLDDQAASAQPTLMRLRDVIGRLEAGGA
jgi:hypothetical protein